MQKQKNLGAEYCLLGIKFGFLQPGTNIFGMRHSHIVHTFLLLTALMTVSCVKDPLETPRFPDTIDNVLIIYSAGQNSLASYLKEDIRDFCKGYLPAGNDPNILLSYQKISSKYTPAPSYLIRYYSYMGRLAADTLLRFPPDMKASSAGTLNEVLAYARDNFPSKGYGLLFSSHATGWLPKGYYSDPDHYDDMYGSSTAHVTAGRTQAEPGIDGSVPYIQPERDPSAPPVKSLGEDRIWGNGQALSYQMELSEFDDAIPMHLDYIFFDCCLMGGIEVAYELRDKCNMILFSPAEVIAEGFDYTKMGKRLLGKNGPDLKGVCSDYYEYYSTHPKGGQYRSATVTLVDCMRLEPVADACRTIFNNCRQGLADIVPDEVQQYYTGNCHWFYDLYDIAVKAGTDDTALAELQDAIDGCIIYKAHTDSFLLDNGYGSGFDIRTYSGFSMYLPCNGSPYLDDSYRRLEWNMATGLIM